MKDFSEERERQLKRIRKKEILKEFVNKERKVIYNCSDCKKNFKNMEELSKHQIENYHD